jgi:flagellar FliJ protein
MSVPFRFGLQRVREIREHDEDQAKERFAASLNARVRGEAVLRAAEQRLVEARSEAVPQPLAPLSGLTLVSRQAWVDRLENARVDAQLRMSNYEAELLRRRNELTAASQAREVLDKLEERQRDEHRREVARAEVNELDEMGLHRYARRSAAA